MRDAILPRVGENCWIITDGKIGDQIPPRGVAEAMGLSVELKTVAPRKIFATLAPFGPSDPRDRARIVRPPFPRIAFAAGRRAVPVLRALKCASPDTFTVFFGNPRTRRSGADLGWAPAHDGVLGDDVIVTDIAPHTRSAAVLAEARETPDPRVATLPAPRATILIGGPSRHHSFGQGDIDAVVAALRDMRAQNFSLAVTTSRRTPSALVARLNETFASDAQTFLWSGEGENPYPTMLALADAILVTADSTNMVGEALASGAPVHVFSPVGGGRRHDVFLDRLLTRNLIRRWNGHLSKERQTPFDPTPDTAAAVAARFAAFQQARRR